MAQVKRISRTIQEYCGHRYLLCGFYFSRSILGGSSRESLHRVVWEAEVGPIPAGFVVHHIDGNRSNNEIENLATMSPRAHSSLHWHLQPGKLEKSRRALKKAQVAARTWHGSDEGRKWHSEHYEKHIRPLLAETATVSCDQCGADFEAKKMYAGASRFCSNNCKSAWRRASGVDNVEAVCVACGASFTKNKYSKVQACSKKCGWIMRRTDAD